MGNVCSAVKSTDDSSDEKKKSLSAPIARSIRGSIREEKTDSSAPSVPIEKEIIIKCSIEEMMKAFFKDYVIVWHDPNLNSQENNDYIVRLRRFCEVFTFTEWQKAKDYVHGAQAVCHVITSGTNGELLVKEIFEKENVCNIYIFCGNKEYHSAWAKNYQKVSCVETDMKNLINQIQQNLLEWYKKVSSLNFSLPAFASIFDDSDKSHMNHLHRYLKVMPNFKSREQAKNDLLNLSKVIYTDPNNQRHIADFEASYHEYNKEKTLRWYTLESFLYKVTNNCLRIATSDSIQYCRLALKDIEQAIKDQYQEKSKNFNGLLYRGAYMSEQEWSSLKENKDKEIEMLGFLSVSKVKNVALQFMQQNLNKMALITILVPKGLNEEEQGFAEIEEFSRYPQEKEILFNVRSRFTVLETEDDYEYSENVKCRHLVLLYGAQGFRKFMNEKNPAQEISIPSMENISCAHCNGTLEKLFFVSITQNQYYCKACIEHGAGPFLCVVPKLGESHTVKIHGSLLINSSQERTPFYGYRCEDCQAQKEKVYFTCTNCEKKWCENCFRGCMEAEHNVILETSPFSFWCEKMSQNELHHLKFQNNLVTESNQTFQQATMYFESHEYAKAIEYYSLYIKNNETNLKDPNLFTSYIRLGKVYEQHGNYKKALEYFFKSLEINKSNSGDNHPLVAASYSNIGRVYELQGDYEKALESQFKALNINKAVLGELHPTVSHCYVALGSVHEKQGEYKEALECYLKSLGIRKSAYGENHPLVSTTYNNIGGVFYAQREYENALEYFMKSLNIGKLIYGDNHPEVATTYCNIGTSFLSQGKYTEALEYLLKALEIEKLIYGDNHPQVATSYNNIGGIYEGQGEYQKAIECHSKALGIYKSAYGENHPLVATSLKNIASTYNKRGVLHYKQEEYEDALENFEKSLEIKKSLYGDSHPAIADSYKNLADVYDEKGEYDKAIEYYLKFADLFKSVFGENHEAVIISFNNIANAYGKQGAFENALEYHLKCLDIKKSLFGDSHLAVAASYNNIGVFYDSQGENEKAIEFFLKCLEIEETAYGDQHPSVGMSCFSIGGIYEKQGEYKDALKYLEKAQEIFKAAYGEYHEAPISIQFKIIQIRSLDQNEQQESRDDAEE